MTSIPDMQAQFRSATQVLGKLLEDLRTDAPPERAALLDRLENIQRDLREIGTRPIELPAMPAVGPTLACAGCVQEAADAAAAGREPRPALPAATVANGNGLCLVRHRISPSAAPRLLIAQGGMPTGGFSAGT